MRDRYYLKVLFNWSPRGRATRSEWWSYNLVHPFVSLALILLSIQLVGDPPDFLIYLFLAYIALSYWLFMALTIRRLHDTGRSAWSFISPVSMLASGFYASGPPNQYGPVPQ